VRDIDLPISFRSPLETFTRDLTEAAVRDQLEPVLCRDVEIERVVTVLMRQSKNNPVLVGEAGVGKTAIAEGLAQRICSGRVPAVLRGTRILAFSHIDLIAGTSFRGQYEKRLQSVIREASADSGIILFIDELHNLIGAGTALGTPMDAANMLKPALTSGRLRVIGATTEMEYDRYVRADSALERRFQPVQVEELERDKTVQVLQARRPRLEMHHLLSIRDGAVEAAADLSDAYLPDRLQPDRSIDMLDETCALARLRRQTEPPAAVLAVQRDRERLLVLEQQAIEDVFSLTAAKGTPLERFSRGTFKVFEAMGLGLEKFVTGQTTPRRPLAPPDSVRRLRERDPAGRLAALHCERLQLEDRLSAALADSGFTVTAADVRAMLKR
jgi:ATP-dependent Clp protease ATP-binding subunit ClpA